MTPQQLELINYKTEIRQREFERRQLWRDTYVASVRTDKTSVAANRAHDAVRYFDETFPDPAPPMINKDKSIN